MRKRKTLGETRRTSGKNNPRSLRRDARASAEQRPPKALGGLSGRVSSVRGAAPARSVTFTHTDRVVFPDAGYTKGDVIDFYARVAPRLLPHLHDRPLTLERLPEGVVPGGPHFWQKNTPSYYPSFIERIRLPALDGKPVEYALVRDERSLLYLVNQNVLTFHVWFSRIAHPDTPDFVLFDIDPHQSTFANAVKVALKLHQLLDGAKIKNFVKTSGKSGLHVMTPWDSKHGRFDEARAFAERVAREVAASMPDVATVERTISKRGRRVYVDAMQNAKGKHAVPPYVLRATPAATVSMPLQWRELTASLRPQQFDLKTALKRIAGSRADPLRALIGGE